MSNNDTSVGLRIREIRESMKVSQKELAQRTGLTQSWISRYERGFQKPGSKKLALFAKALKVPVSAFFADTAQATGIEQYLIENLRDEEKEHLQKILDQPVQRQRLFELLGLLTERNQAVEGLVDNLLQLSGEKNQ